MKLTLLSRSRTVASTRLLADAAESAGHTVRILNPNQVNILMRGQGTRLLSRGRVISVPQVVIPRIPASSGEGPLLVAEQFERLGATSLNSASALRLARSPARVVQALSSSGIATPRTVVLREVGALESTLRKLGGVPVQVHPLGTEAPPAPAICDSLKVLEAVLDALLGLGHAVMLREHLKRSSKWHRVMVINGQAQGLAKGDHEARAAAEGAAKATGLQLCSVDLAPTARGWLVVDLNACPVIPDAAMAEEVIRHLPAAT